MLCKSPVVRNPDFTKTFFRQTDASDRGLGAVPSQLNDEGTSGLLQQKAAREERYSTVEKECLAIKLGVKAFYCEENLLSRQTTGLSYYGLTG